MSSEAGGRNRPLYQNKEDGKGVSAERRCVKINLEIRSKTHRETQHLTHSFAQVPPKGQIINRLTATPILPVTHRLIRPPRRAWDRPAPPPVPPATSPRSLPSASDVPGGVAAERRTPAEAPVVRDGGSGAGLMELTPLVQGRGRAGRRGAAA